MTLPEIGAFRAAFMVSCQTVALLFVFQFCAAAQQLQVRNWQIENGLPDGTVTSVAQTLDGYLWVGTPKGLARFDGISFKRIGAAGNTTLKDSSVVGLLTDREGTLWIASQSGLITQFADGEFRVRYSPAATPGREPPAARLPPVDPGRKLDRVFALDGDGAVWVLTLGGEVIRFTGPGEPTGMPPGDLPPGEAHGLGNDESGRVWLVKGTRICVFEEGQWRLSAVGEVAGSNSLLCPAGDGACWVAGVSNSQATAKLLQCRKGGGWDVSSPAMPATSVAAYVSAMLEDRQGRVWMAMSWGGIWGGVYAQLRPGEWTPVQATGPLVKCSARCLFEDRQGSIWVGTAGDGLDQVLVPPVRMAMLPPEGADMHITSVCTAKDGSIWMGTDKGLFRRAPGEYSRVSAVEGLSGERVEAVLEDARTNLWVATRTGVFQRTSSGFKRVVALPDSDDGIMSLYESRAGDVWAGGPHGVLLCRRGGAPGADFELKAQNPSLDIRCIAEDGRGQIWIAAYGTGLWRLDGKRFVPADLQLGPAGSTIRSVLCDSDGALWIGTLGSGLFRWSNGLLRHYTLADGLVDDSIIGLASDEKGNLWMTSKNGIFGCALRQLAGYVRGESAPLLFRHLGLDEGLAHRQCTGGGQPVISRGSDGRFWAATMAGAAGFDPEMVTRSTFPEEVRVETLTADGQVLRPAAQAYRVSASTRRFEFQYSAPELAAPKALRFRYRLDDLDQNWVEAGAGRVASYSQLQPGAYRFRVMVGGADGLWHEAEKPVALRVVPLFWQTLWFRTLGISTAVMVLLGGVALNERRKASRQLERLEAQQAMERERRRIARDLHDDLGSGITEIVQIGDLTLQPEIGTETLRTRVKTMTARARQLGIIMDEIVWTVNPRNDTLPNLVGYISNHAQEFFRHSGIKCRLDVTKSLPVLAVDAQTRHNIFLAVKEALNNVAKHSGANEVWVRVHYSEEGLRVFIEDNGRGFDGAAFDKGDGLTNMRERLHSVKGKAEFVSQTDSGAKVVFTLGLGTLTGERK